MTNSLNEIFEFRCGYRAGKPNEGLIADIESNPTEFNAVTAAAIHKQLDELVIVVMLPENGKPDVNTMAHEAVHVADFYCEMTGMLSQEFYQGNEHYAYLVGWVAKCIEDASKTFYKK